MIFQGVQLLSIGILGEYVGAYRRGQAKAGVPVAAAGRGPSRADADERRMKRVLTLCADDFGSARHQRRIAGCQFERLTASHASPTAPLVDAERLEGAESWMSSCTELHRGSR